MILIIIVLISDTYFVFVMQKYTLIFIKIWFTLVHIQILLDSFPFIINEPK